MEDQGFVAERQLIAFALAKESYGIEISQVQEIIRIINITRVPHTPDYIKGVINLRGNIIPVIDLRKRLDLPAGEFNEKTRIIVVEAGDIVAGLVVDEVFEVLRLPENDIEAPPERFSGEGKNYIKGIGKKAEQLLVLLDLEDLIRLEKVGSRS